ncbi:FAD binding domain-containing protein [Lophiostoma macrostomum CBS 122681]|uniref:FAD binding domain-containing protein n=1 Tax=Lophiostoma macrostomum CBS 122681 TaxID=1314788 RepID=A0A6A6T1A1_9PLEO|nr:FAD binding domain-containing protein [Lophiostoma macrostomum CBS 122681]
MDSVANDLKGLTSCEAVTTTLPERWSTYDAPQPGVIVNATTEDDVAATVKYCAEKNIPFLAQGGANGWAEFNLTSNGVLINLAALNQTTFNGNKTQATIGGGATVNSTIQAADKAGAFVLTGNCNCVGTLGATLGGGYGNLMGTYGFGVDQLISARVVTADGSLVTASESENSDLFWAIRGAGPNFGIVTSAVFKSYPSEDRTGFNMALVFTPDNITEVVKTVEKVRENLQPAQNVYLYLTNGGPPSNTPAIVVTGFLLHASEDEGKAAFQPLYDLGPVAITNVTLPYSQWNAAADSFCTRSQRKPGLNQGITKLVPEQWTEIWDLYAEFQKKPSAENSVVIVEMYNLEKARSIPADSTAFPHRDVNAQAFVIPWYGDAGLDDEALAFASKVRDIWRSNEKTVNARRYINFAHGDEGLDAIYGESVSKLKVIKQKWDPKNRFNQWFPIQ